MVSSAQGSLLRLPFPKNSSGVGFSFSFLEKGAWSEMGRALARHWPSIALASLHFWDIARGLGARWAGHWPGIGRPSRWRRYISGTLPGHCRDISGTSPRRCRGTSGHCRTLPGPCRDLAGTLPGHCRGIAGALQGHFRDIAAHYAGALPGPSRDIARALPGHCPDIAGTLPGHLPGPCRGIAGAMPDLYTGIMEACDHTCRILYHSSLLIYIHFLT